jgi:hypothetical protein
MDDAVRRQAIWRAAGDGDRGKLDELVYALDWGHRGHIPDATIQLLVDTLTDAEFVLSPAADVMAEAFEQMGISVGLDVKQLPSDQHAKLMRAFEFALPVASYQLSFHISVLLGERFHDAGALEVLRRLRTASDAGVRERVAHALQHFAVECADAELRRRAHAALRDMVDDPDEGTRANVVYYLDNIEQGRAF